MKISAQTLINVAEKEIGYKEGANNDNKYGKAYGTNNVSWCMQFIWWLFKTAGASEHFYDGKKCASCTQLMNWAKGKNQFIDKSKMKPGDIVIYDWDNSGDGDHVGVVVATSLLTVTAIEGNTSSGDKGSQSNGDGVYKRTRKLSTVRGAYRPSYKVTYSGTIPSTTLKKGAKGTQVKYLQQFLNWYGGYGLDPDGSFGPLTDKAVRMYQAREQLQVDGSFGPKSRARAKEVVR